MIQAFTRFQEQVFDDSIMVYGVEAQLDQVQEECIELALAIRKYKRAKANPDSIPHEGIRESEMLSKIADVIIMVNQCRKIFPDSVIQDEIIRKLNRQRQRIDRIILKRTK